MAQSDRDRFLRQFPIIVGIVGSSLLVLNRFFTPDLLPSQSRSDVVGVLLSALLILTGLLWQRIQTIAPDAVELQGEKGFEFATDLPEEIQTELAWASQLLLKNTVTRTLLIWYDHRVILRRGILVKKTLEMPGTILQRVLEKGRPVYLVDLKLYPGRFEFVYLPENTQGLICQPLSDRGVLILGANAPRSYTQQDEAWIEGIADKLSVTLANGLPLQNS